VREEGGVRGIGFNRACGAARCFGGQGGENGGSADRPSGSSLRDVVFDRQRQD
jgi:hypothetical protein